MFISNKKRKLNNSGFSLVEILIALAITAIVATVIMTFITNSGKYYRKQTTSINLQNELQETSNRITDALMEATDLKIDYRNDRVCIYTGSDGDYNNPDAKVKPKLIVWEQNTGEIYILEGNNPDAKDPAYRMTKYCSNLTITPQTINTESSTDVLGQVKYTYTFKAPVSIKVDIRLENTSDTNNSDYIERSDSKTTVLRNKISTIKIRPSGSMTYTEYQLTK